MHDDTDDPNKACPDKIIVVGVKRPACASPVVGLRRLRTRVTFFPFVDEPWEAHMRRRPPGLSGLEEHDPQECSGAMFSSVSEVLCPSSVYACLRGECRRIRQQGRVRAQHVQEHENKTGLPLRFIIHWKIRLDYFFFFSFSSSSPSTPLTKSPGGML